MVSGRLILLTLGAASAAVASSPTYLRQRQATRATVIQRLFLRDVQSPQPSQAPTPTCICWEGGPACPNDCPESCPEKPAETVTQKRRSLPTARAAAKKVRGAIPRRQFGGEFLTPAHAARFLADGGEFRHANGSHVRDDEFIANNARLRARAAQSFAGHALIRRGAERLVRFGGGWLAGRVLRFVVAGGEEAMVVPFSDEWALRVEDLMPTVRELLADADLVEVNVYHHSISRATLEEILAAMCPRMGEQICGDAAHVLEADESE